MALTKPQQLNELLQRAIDSYHAGHQPEAIDLLARASKQFPKSARLWGYLGFLYAESGAGPNAVKAFRKAAQISPHSEQASLGLFHSLWQLGRADDAFNEMRRFMKANDSPNYLELLRDMLSDKGRRTSHAASLTVEEVHEVEAISASVGKPGFEPIDLDESADRLRELTHA
jgi:tetratricopeptide (TPR) repeat protein